MLWSCWNKSHFIGIGLLPAFFPPQKIPQKFCYFILGQEARKLKCQKFPQKQNLMLWPGQALLYYSFIYFHFFQVISCLHRNWSASCHCSEPSDLGLVALLWLMKGGRVGPSACSEKEFVKRNFADLWVLLSQDMQRDEFHHLGVAHINHEWFSLGNMYNHRQNKSSEMQRAKTSQP